MEGKVNELNSLTEDKEALLSQYANIIDSFTSSYRFDTNYKITYCNEIFKKNMHIFSLEKDIQLKDIFENEFYKEHIDIIIKTLQNKEKYKNIIVYFINNEKKYMDATITPILDKNGNLLEFMVIEYEITDILKAQQEVIDTQKDIIFTMGEIAIRIISPAPLIMNLAEVALNGQNLGVLWKPPFRVDISRAPTGRQSTRSECHQPVAESTHR